MNIYNDKVTHRFGEQEPNHVLPPPPINPDEIKLTRTARSRLSQLRSGFSRLLNSFLNRLIIKLKINVPNVKPHLTIQTTCLIVKQIQPAFPLPAYRPTTWARNQDVLCTLHVKFNRFNTNLK